MTLPKNIYTCICALTISLTALMPQHADAQQRKAKAAEPDTIPWFRGVAVSVDAVGPVQRWISSYGQYEAALRINLKDRYFPIVEVGIGNADREDEVTGIRYKTTGPYGRIGCDFNLLKDKHDIYRVYFGARYGFTSFKYDITGTNITDPVYKNEVEYAGSGIKCTYHWGELVAGVDAKIYGPLRLGWSVRYRNRFKESHGDMGSAWYVPGFGISGTSALGATFNIIIEL